ncbi:hypothetical protein GIB67_029112 [Kingdonia uniflora]|uniref:RING-type E3 ubiquitin transferase n=1 Tax=Kingdonia uniflora TaxID=39325 RepID=A0A7J7N6Y4_9MAGN|nr:hypothetical protein GIB67_029112 [Kingdonia uniflora]
MGVSWSNNNNENNNNRRRPNSLFQTQSPSQLISSYISDPNPPPPQQPNQPQIPYPTPQYQPQISYPTSHHPPNPYYYQQHYNNNNNCGYTGPVIGGSNYTPIIPSYYVPNNNGWPGIRPPPMSVPMPQPPYVNHQEAKKVRNDVNVHKDTISIHVDEKNPDYHLVSFTFDALVDGRIVGIEGVEESLK